MSTSSFTCAAVVVCAASLVTALSGVARRTQPTSPSSAALALLPDDATKRQFILDCTGCHQISEQHLYVEGRPRSRAEWTSVINRMLSFAGPESNFPVMGPRDADETAAWLTAHVGDRRPAAPAGPAANEAVTEFTYPHATDLPHDLAVLEDGRIAITGMFTDQIVILSPVDGSFVEMPIPVTRANPRSLEVAANGDWFIALGAPTRVARFEAASGSWSHWDIGYYAHEARYDGNGRLWYNAHFSRRPVIVGYVDITTGEVVEIEVPTPERLAELNPVPYGLAIGPDARVWGTDLRGNRIYAVDPDTRTVTTWDMPTPHSGPRRPDFDARGNLWIPEYANNTLTVFDPGTETFRSWPLPIPDALPYIVRINADNGVVWIATAAADAVLAFDPVTEEFAVHALPTFGALVRHIDIDEQRNEVWAAYGASPGIPPKIARLRLNGRLR